MKSNPQLSFQIIAKCSTTRARVSKIHFAHHIVDAPVFMPVGTQGTMKGIPSDQMEKMGCQILLGNTYHLGNAPGEELMSELGGLHKFMSWNRAILTDSGGFQMVSLLKLANITEAGVEFASPRDGSLMLLTPEKSMQLQHAIGADVIMQLDDVVHTLTEGTRMEEAMHRSVRWLDRCIEERGKEPCGGRYGSAQNLFPIIQGGLDLDLRTKCIEEMTKRSSPGLAIGGLSGGEDKSKFCEVVNHCTKTIESSKVEDKPIYCMGVGYAVDMLVAVALGVDMFDCVFPTRTARFGNALVRFNSGQLVLKQHRYETDFSPIDPSCPCLACTKYTRAAIRFMISRRETTACHLLTLHNLTFQLRLMADIRESIRKDKFPEFIDSFLASYYDHGSIPEWIRVALSRVGLDIKENRNASI